MTRYTEAASDVEPGIGRGESPLFYRSQDQGAALGLLGDRAEGMQGRFVGGMKVVKWGPEYYGDVEARTSLSGNSEASQLDEVR